MSTPGFARVEAGWLREPQARWCPRCGTEIDGDTCPECDDDVPPTGPNRAGDALLVASLLSVFPVAPLMAVTHGQAAGIAAVAVAMCLMLTGWVIGS